jgi:hypothetical protein
VGLPFRLSTVEIDGMNRAAGSRQITFLIGVFSFGDVQCEDAEGLSAVEREGSCRLLQSR